MSKVIYTFGNVDQLIGNIHDYVKTTNIDDFMQSGRESEVLGEVPLQVKGLTRDKPPKEQIFDFAVSVESYAPTRDPMEILDEKWGDHRWLIEIKIAPKYGDDGNGNCFLMQIFIPVNNPEGVVVSWLNQIMINFNTHKQVTPEQCFLNPKRRGGLPNGGTLPNYQWGTLFMQLYEAISMQLTKTTFVFPVRSSEPSAKRTLRRTTPRRGMHEGQDEYVAIPMPVLGGLVDDAFVQYCGGAVVFSDLRRLMGMKPWYETFAFVMANEREYKNAFLSQKTYVNASDSVTKNYTKYMTNLQACLESPPVGEELSAACQLGCESCADGSCMKTHQDLYKFIGEKISNNAPGSCKWISDEPPTKTCLANFNRHLNAQTMHIHNTADDKIYDYVVRLKFYSLL